VACTLDSFIPYTLDGAFVNALWRIWFVQKAVEERPTVPFKLMLKGDSIVDRVHDKTNQANRPTVSVLLVHKRHACSNSVFIRAPSSEELHAIMRERSLLIGLLCLFAFLNVGVWGSNFDNRELTIADIPACGVSPHIFVSRGATFD